MNKQKEKLISYCGLYCPGCYKMVVFAAAKSLQAAINNSNICESVNNPSVKFKKELEKLAGLRCFKTCKDGGGKADCAIRKCCKSKKLVGCWECDGFEKCDKLKSQFIKNIKKIKKVGVYAFSIIKEK